MQLKHRTAFLLGIFPGVTFVGPYTDKLSGAGYAKLKRIPGVGWRRMLDTSQPYAVGKSEAEAVARLEAKYLDGEVNMPPL